jgi:hypothetical protein
MSFHENRNLSDRLIKIIEANAENLTKGTIEKLQQSSRTISYHALSYEELYSRIYRVYHDLGRWLWENSNQAVESWYRELGEQRRREGIPLVEVLWALVLTKDRLVNYLDACGPVDSIMELYRQQEFDRIIGHFFDRAMCYAAEGYSRRPAISGKGESVTVIQ